jgi:hypothetical protein
LLVVELAVTDTAAEVAEVELYIFLLLTEQLLMELIV